MITVENIIVFLLLMLLLTMISSCWDLAVFFPAWVGAPGAILRGARHTRRLEKKYGGVKRVAWNA